MGEQHWQRLTYRELFQQFVGVDPHAASIDELKALLQPHFDCPFTDARKDTWLELVMSHLIEPKLIEPTLVTDFPASQAALAEIKLDEFGVIIATRFELYAGGMELANGYQELRETQTSKLIVWMLTGPFVNQQACHFDPLRPV